MRPTELQLSTAFFENIRRAGRAILDIYNSKLVVDYKADKSPVTEADRLSHSIVTTYLQHESPFPVLSEEGKDIPYESRRHWETFWLVDPLDGTKEFISGNGEFTVNVALITDTVPVMGVIYVPVKDIFYYAVKGNGSYKIESNKRFRLPLDQIRKEIAVVGSRSHKTPEFDVFLETLRTRHGEISFVSAGSSLKFCLVAEGIADLYPRLGPTMEWDTAAGHIIAEEAGGTVVESECDRPLRYNKPVLKNPHFIVKGRSYHVHD